MLDFLSVIYSHVASLETLERKRAAEKRIASSMM